MAMTKSQKILLVLAGVAVVFYLELIFWFDFRMHGHGRQEAIQSSATQSRSHSWAKQSASAPCPGLCLRNPTL